MLELSTGKRKENSTRMKLTHSMKTIQASVQEKSREDAQGSGAKREGIWGEKPESVNKGGPRNRRMNPKMKGGVKKKISVDQKGEVSKCARKKVFSCGSGGKKRELRKNHGA